MVTPSGRPAISLIFFLQVVNDLQRVLAVALMYTMPLDFAFAIPVR